MAYRGGSSIAPSRRRESASDVKRKRDILHNQRGGWYATLMETFFDMHCHLGFVPSPGVTAKDGAAAGIGAFSCTVEPAEYEQLQLILASAPNVALGLGAHPWWIADGRVGETELARFCELARTTRFIGEIGLDFAGPRDTEESRALQTSAFACILAACNEPVSPLASIDPESAAATSGQGRTRTATTNLQASPPIGGAPVRSATDTAPKLISIHAVNAAAAALDALEQAGAFALHHVIFHWFSGTSDDLHRAVELGCFFSVGPRMLASRRGREYARQIPVGQLLLETDMPAHVGDELPAEVWRAELGNALSGIAQLKGINREALAHELAETSSTLLRF